MIKALLIDDERDALEVLEWQLKNYCPQIEVLALCIGAEEGIAGIKALKPQLVFLDIEMPVMNGFDVLLAFEDPQFSVIFTTAYNQYAIKANQIRSLRLPGKAYRRYRPAGGRESLRAERAWHHS